jgi:RNA polymerase sigma factor (sigma-70 family)
VKEKTAVIFYNAEEQADLIIQYRRFGDIEARDKLIFSNEKLVQQFAHRVAARTNKKTISYEDLYQEGMLGLLKALEKFDLERGIKFTSYAWFYIKKYVNAAAYNNLHMCKLPTTPSKKKLIWSWSKICKEIEDKGLKVTLETAAEHLDTTPEQLRPTWEVKMNLSSRISFDRSFHEQNIDEGANDRVHQMAGESLFNNASSTSSPEIQTLIKECSEHIGAYADTLSPRRRDVFIHRVMELDEDTLESIGERWGITKQRVAQIQADVDEHFRRYVQRVIKK